VPTKSKPVPAGKPKKRARTPRVSSVSQSLIDELKRARRIKGETTFAIAPDPGIAQLRAEIASLNERFKKIEDKGELFYQETDGIHTVSIRCEPNIGGHNQDMEDIIAWIKDRLKRIAENRKTIDGQQPPYIG
jgi:hypothetical protein